MDNGWYKNKPNASLFKCDFTKENIVNQDDLDNKIMGNSLKLLSYRTILRDKIQFVGLFFPKSHKTMQ